MSGDNNCSFSEEITVREVLSFSYRSSDQEDISVLLKSWNLLDPEEYILTKLKEELVDIEALKLLNEDDVFRIFQGAPQGYIVKFRSKLKKWQGSFDSQPENDSKLKLILKKYPEGKGIIQHYAEHLNLENHHRDKIVDIIISECNTNKMKLHFSDMEKLSIDAAKDFKEDSRIYYNPRKGKKPASGILLQAYYNRIVRTDDDQSTSKKKQKTNQQVEEIPENSNSACDCSETQCLLEHIDFKISLNGSEEEIAYNITKQLTNSDDINITLNQWCIRLLRFKKKDLAGCLNYQLMHKYDILNFWKLSDKWFLK